jgi:hypothetical protein
VTHGELFVGEFAGDFELSRGDHVKARRVPCPDMGVDISRKGKAKADIPF